MILLPQMQKIFPKKLNIGDEVRVIAPARSMAIISQETQNIANKRFEEMGLKLTFGKHVNESDDFLSSSIENRVEDFDGAFSDPNVKAILTVIGGFNSNQILRYVDWENVKNNPKIFCGYSDITALNNAVFAKTGLVNYSGPHYSTFGQELYVDYTLEYFKKCLFSDEFFEILPSTEWTDDAWYMDQKNRNPIKNDGWLAINEGEAEGTLLGSNLCTFNLLQGTEFMPDIKDSILFLEDSADSNSLFFDRDLQSLIHLSDFNTVKGLVIGRFQKDSKVSNENIKKIIKSKKELDNIPVIVNVDFGHTEPRNTLPIGGNVKISVSKDNSVIKFLEH